MWRFIIRIPILIVTLAQIAPGVTSVSSALEVQCVQIFSGLDTQRFPILNPNQVQPEWIRGAFNPGRGNTDMTIDVFRFADNPNGWWLKIQLRDGEDWYSDATTIEGGVQGDPRFPFAFLGREVAAVLGFTMTDTRSVIYPTVDRINWGLELLNLFLPTEELALIRFYAAQVIDNMVYIDRFADKFEIPVLKSNHFMIVHDLGLHLSVLISPNHLIHRKRIVFSEVFRPIVRQLQEPLRSEFLSLIGLVGDATFATHLTFLLWPDLTSVDKDLESAGAGALYGNLSTRLIVRHIMNLKEPLVASAQLKSVLNRLSTEQPDLFIRADALLRQHQPAITSGRELLHQLHDRRNQLRQAARNLLTSGLIRPK